MPVIDCRYRRKEIWKRVRPVVIHFAEERLVVDYNESAVSTARPLVAMVHSYLKDTNLADIEH